ncbi:hypothetical protein FJZ31_10365 [Candidatus Poribacteria bacterium]|nr:hypothetical protein [Candidatus Poribacteria bacterium]
MSEIGMLDVEDVGYSLLCLIKIFVSTWKITVIVQILNLKNYPRHSLRNFHRKEQRGRGAGNSSKFTCDLELGEKK